MKSIRERLFEEMEKTLFLVPEDFKAITDFILSPQTLEMLKGEYGINHALLVCLLEKKPYQPQTSFNLKEGDMKSIPIQYKKNVEKLICDIGHSIIKLKPYILELSESLEIENDNFKAEIFIKSNFTQPGRSKDEEDKTLEEKFDTQKQFIYDPKTLAQIAKEAAIEVINRVAERNEGWKLCCKHLKEEMEKL